MYIYIHINTYIYIHIYTYIYAECDLGKKALGVYRNIQKEMLSAEKGTPSPKRGKAEGKLEKEGEEEDERQLQEEKQAAEVLPVVKQ
jgi:hypothetical protein